jgi:hypothetical protein
VEFVGPEGELSPLRGLSGAELCPSGHIPLRGIQIKAEQIPTPTLKCTDELGHVYLRPNSSANRQSNSKSANAMPRPIMPAAPPRQQPRRAAFGRDRSRRSAPEIYRRPGRGPSPPRFLLSFIFGLVALLVLSIVSASCPTAVARPLHKGRGGGGATGRRPYNPPSPFQGQNHEKLPSWAPKDTARPERGGTRANRAPKDTARPFQ